MHLLPTSTDRRLCSSYTTLHTKRAASKASGCEGMETCCTALLHGVGHFGSPGFFTRAAQSVLPVLWHQTMHTAMPDHDDRLAFKQPCGANGQVNNQGQPKAAWDWPEAPAAWDWPEAAWDWPKAAWDVGRSTRFLNATPGPVWWGLLRYLLVCLLCGVGEKSPSLTCCTHVHKHLRMHNAPFAWEHSTSSKLWFANSTMPACRRTLERKRCVLNASTRGSERLGLFICARLYHTTNAR